MLLGLGKATRMRNASFSIYVLASFLFLYVTLLQYSRSHYYRDPTSAFFDADRGFDQVYSRFRTAQAAKFIRRIDATASPRNRTALPGTGVQGTNASLCVGIASIARENVDYVEAAVGSLMLDLTEREREDIHLILFIPHPDPSLHPAYAKKWPSAVADTLLRYDLPDSQMAHIKQLENDGDVREKSLVDYAYLLNACRAVGAPYALMVEDDVIAMDGWYHRTREALADAERQTHDLGASKYLYLRLFYTQKFLGWNSEEWPSYLLFSLLIISAVAGALILARRYILYKGRLSNGTVAVLAFVCTPMCIILFFTAGRVSMLPPPAGVHQMPRFGCCSQALAFQRDRISDVVGWFEAQHAGYVDTLLERYADTNNEFRWALTPSVFQHIGSKSSKPGRVAKTIWNYQFEANDPVVLQLEHETVAAGL